MVSYIHILHVATTAAFLAAALSSLAMRAHVNQDATWRVEDSATKYVGMPQWQRGKTMLSLLRMRAMQSMGHITEWIYKVR